MKTTQHQPYIHSVPPVDPLAIAWQLGDRDMIRALTDERAAAARPAPINAYDWLAAKGPREPRDPALGGWVGIAIMVAVAVFIGVLLATGGVL